MPFLVQIEQLHWDNRSRSTSARNRTRPQWHPPSRTSGMSASCADRGIVPLAAARRGGSMSGGLLALFDDIAALAKVAAASIDDVAGQAAKAGTKAAGVVIDDTAVTPRYVTGFSPARELPIIGRIALGSLKNKLLILLPAALALSLLLPQAITPLLMI